MLSVDDDDERRLTEDLFNGYKPNIRPVLKKTDNVTIKFGLSLHQVIAVVRGSVSPLDLLARFQSSDFIPHLFCFFVNKLLLPLKKDKHAQL